MLVELFEYPTNDDWAEVRRRALVTVGKKKADIPTKSWKEKILKARHSPIRRLHFAFYIECPYWVSVHLVSTFTHNLMLSHREMTGKVNMTEIKHHKMKWCV